MSKYKTTPEETSGLPRGVKYIIGNEAAERFSFYGMRTILVVFMTRYLHLMSDGGVGGPMTGAEANEAYHNFVTWVYFFPVIGSLLSDILIGKYRTILWLSIVYCFGHLALAFIGEGGLSAEQWMWVGLLLISIGAGGIKPCVSAHVGDQFGKRNSHLMTMVYQWFYFSVNLGSTLSTALTPVLLKWYGPHVAFGVPGVLMALATLMFWMGRHVFIHVPPSGMKFFSETFSKDGLLALAKLSIVYAFVAVFWAVFDQTGSSWVLQAENMDRRFLWVDWLESQIQVVNPILVMAFIPVFQFVIYPNVEKVFRLTAIRKIGIGLFLTAGSFALLTAAQGLIDRGQTPSIAWQLWAYVLLTAGEIMISITGLEFSYTQAPKSMKSVIMAVWLFSVSLGNFFTSTVNHQIQTPGMGELSSALEEVEQGEPVATAYWQGAVDSLTRKDADTTKVIRLNGFDDTADTADDVLVTADGYNAITNVETAENAVLLQAAERIDQAFLDSNPDASQGVLLNTDEGQQRIDDLVDSQGQKLRYKQLTRNVYRITSAGSDKVHQTQWDVVLMGRISREEKTDSQQKEARLTWLENRIIELKGEAGKQEVERARGDIPETEITHNITVGGQDTLEGADYFAFWTKVVLITAVLFIPVGYFYKEKSYIQESDTTEPVGEDSH